MTWAIGGSYADISTQTLAYTVSGSYEARLTVEFANRSTTVPATIELWVVPANDGAVANKHYKEAGTTLSVAGTRQSVLTRKVIAPGGAIIYVRSSTANVSCQVSGDVLIPTSIQAGYPAASFTDPAWATYTGIYNGVRFVIGGYPVASQFGLNAVPIVETVVGAIDIPSTSTAANHGTGISGYARSASVAQGGVGVFGYGGMAANGVSAWAMNTVTSNASGPQGASNSGFTNGTIYGIELDFNLYKNASVSPNVAMRGIYFIGASEVQSSSPVVYAIDIDQHGYLSNIPWKRGLSLSGAYGISATDGFYTEDGATARSINVGTLTAANNVGSQPIQMRSRSAGAINYSSTIVCDASANMVFNSGNTSAVFAFQQNGAVQTQFVNGAPQFALATPVPAGGSSAASLTMSTTAALGIYVGSGAPTVSAAKGSLYMRTDGSSTSTRAYVNTDGATAWTNLTSAT